MADVMAMILMEMATTLAVEFLEQLHYTRKHTPCGVV